ncbi:hypothetical protein BD410DRAFT_575333 [Rickenella mellea]|uniref:F-box domain-containing protein n=1 Tax=Rickenella mellea TaxID=50990 RepID=A0A4Y7QGN4_9AGAM|nr:hypothetical protein BD410DRAFT_575333 [Rickenella mellea]
MQISEFIARSSNVSALEIYAFPWTGRKTSPSDDALSQFLDLLLPQSSRWSRLTFQDHEYLRLAFHTRTNIQLPKLRHLTTSYDDDFREGTPIWANWEMRLLNSYSAVSFADTYFWPQLEVTDCKLRLSGESLDIARLTECLNGMRQLQNLTPNCNLSGIDVSTVLTNPMENVVVLSIHSLALRLSCMESNCGVQFKYLQRIYSHVQFRELSQLEITLDRLVDRLAHLATAGLSPYPSKFDFVDLNIDSGSSHISESFGIISRLLPGVTNVGELRIDTLQSSPLFLMGGGASPGVRAISFKRCEWLSEGDLSDLITMYVDQGNVRSLNIIACRNVSEEFIRGNARRAKMKMRWSLY